MEINKEGGNSPESKKWLGRGFMAEMVGATPDSISSKTVVSLKEILEQVKGVGQS